MKCRRGENFCGIFSLFTILISFVSLISFISCTDKAGPETRSCLGTVCSVNAYEDGTRQLYDEILSRLNVIDSEMSVTDDDSEVSRINKNAGKCSVEVSPDTFYVIEKALFFAELSDGAFDPTVGPLVDLWGINTDHARVPSDEEISQVLPLVDWTKVVLEEAGDSRSVYLTQEGMKLNLGGIAKGYAADEIALILQKHNVRKAIVDLGGNLYLWGNKEDGSDWKVGVKNPFDPGATPALLLKTHGSTSVVTSGPYERFFEQDGVRYHHILDLSTGKSAVRSWSSTSIICSSSMEADALSTIGFLCGREKLEDILSENYGIEPFEWIFISNDKSVSCSTGLKSNLECYDESFTTTTE